MLNTKNKGSVTIEATIIIPMFIFIFFIIIGMLRLILLYNCVSNAMYKTANLAYNYGIIYHENGIDLLSDTIKNRIGDSLNITPLISYAEDKLYQSMFGSYFETKLNEDSVYKELFKDKVSWNFNGTGFYNNDELLLTGTFKYNILLPFQNKLSNGISFNKTIRIKILTTGSSYMKQSNTENSSVWQLSNFERGKIIESEFNSNLPEYFPVIDYYENGTAISVVSINHTLSSYQNEKNLELEMSRSLEELISFKNGEYGKTQISEQQIKNKEIIFVFPENEMTENQKNIIDIISKKANSAGVKIRIEKYQFV